MVLTRQASVLVLSRMLVCGAAFLASRCYTSPSSFSHGDAEVSACYQRACWMVNTKSLTCPPGRPPQAGLFGEEIPWSLWQVSGGNGLIRLALPPKWYWLWLTCKEFMFENPSGDVRRDRGGARVWKTVQPRGRWCFKRSQKQKLIFKIQPPYAHAFPL